MWRTWTRANGQCCSLFESISIVEPAAEMSFALGLITKVVLPCVVPEDFLIDTVIIGGG